MIGVAAATNGHALDTRARILVVEEEPIVAIMLDDALNDAGYHVLGPVENLKAAIHLAATEYIDAAVVDTNIDGRIAEGVTDKLMERGIPFVFIDSHTRVINLRYSEIGKLQKPFTIETLHDTIARLLEGSRVPPRLNAIPLDDLIVGV
jgi:DNA-binding NtrC family response regulator